MSICVIPIFCIVCLQLFRLLGLKPKNVRWGAGSMRGLGRMKTSLVRRLLRFAAMQSAAAEIWMYGDPTSYDLRCAGRTFGIGLDNIVVGEGIDGLLGYVVRMFIEAGDAVVTSDGAYPTFNYHVAGFGGVLHKVPLSQ